MMADIHAAIITHYVAGAFAVATYYQGQDVTVDAGDTHARVEVAMLENASVGNGSLGYTQASGTFTVDLRYPTNTGSGAALAVADLIAVHFRRGESATYNAKAVWFRGASISQPAAVDGWTSVLVTVQWTAKVNVDFTAIYETGFWFTVNTENFGTSGTDQFTLPTDGASAYSYNIRWGDGTEETITSNAAQTHTYPAPGIYQVKIRGTFPAIKFGNGGDAEKLVTIDQVGDVGWASFNMAFYGCVNLTAITVGTANTSGVGDFEYAFARCGGLTSFPALDTSGATSIRSAWSQCGSLTSFPLLNLSAVTNALAAWENCVALTSFPAVSLTSATDVQEAWRGCYGLTSFPALSLPAVLTLADAWIGCSGIVSFPAVSAPLCTVFTKTWYGCQGMTTFGMTDMGAAVNLNSAWVNCAITSFPLINTANVTNMNSAWRYCDALTSFPVLDFSSVISASQAFSNTTLPTAVYSALLVGIAAQPGIQSGVVFGGGSSKYDTSAVAARAYLVGTKGWTITDGGPA